MNHVKYYNDAHLVIDVQNYMLNFLVMDFSHSSLSHIPSRLY